MTTTFSIVCKKWNDKEYNSMLWDISEDKSIKIQDQEFKSYQIVSKIESEKSIENKRKAITD